ncbi:MAG: serine/threonine-protein phosphatase [Phycisphaerales bacterium]|nr:serine/threonine-protein phosphatase [Phycisphaerales bacterium]
MPDHSPLSLPHKVPRVPILCREDREGDAMALAEALNARFHSGAGVVAGDRLVDHTTFDAAEAVILFGTRGEPDPRVDCAMDSANRLGLPTLALIDDARGTVEPIALTVLPLSASIDLVAGVLRGLIARSQEIDKLRGEKQHAVHSTGGMKVDLDRIQDELQLASSVQREFLPRTIPTVGGVSCSALWRPASYVSGDIYTVQRLDEHHIGYFIADAVGHGVPAALLTLVIARSLPTKEIDGSTYRIMPPGEALARVNADLLARSSQSTRFATAIYIVLDTRDLSMRLACGGHPPPLRLRPDGELIAIDTQGGLLGVFEDERYEETQASLKSGDKLLLYSDGFEQAFPNPGHLVGQPRMPNLRYHEVFRSLAHLSDPRAFVDAVARRVDADARDEEQSDDLTLLCVSVP